MVGYHTRSTKKATNELSLYFPAPNFPPKLDVQYYLRRQRSDHVYNLRTSKIVDMVSYDMVVFYGAEHPYLHTSLATVL